MLKSFSAPDFVSGSILIFKLAVFAITNEPPILFALLLYPIANAFAIHCNTFCDTFHALHVFRSALGSAVLDPEGSPGAFSLTGSSPHKAKPTSESFLTWVLTALVQARGLGSHALHVFRSALGSAVLDPEG
jgi:hypothetical protein